MMQIDNSYTPLRSDFDVVVKSHFNGQPISAAMREMMESAFYAGAASSYAVMSKTPEKATILYEELADYAGHTAAAL